MILKKILQNIFFLTLSWFAGDMSREDADERLQNQKDNTYLVRLLIQLNHKNLLFNSICLHINIIMRTKLQKCMHFLCYVSSTFTVNDKKKFKSCELVINVE